MALQTPKEPLESPPESPGTDAGRPGVDFPAVFIQIHGNLTDFKPQNLPEGPGGEKVLQTPYLKRILQESSKDFKSTLTPSEKHLMAP